MLICSMLIFVHVWRWIFCSVSLATCELYRDSCAQNGMRRIFDVFLYLGEVESGGFYIRALWPSNQHLHVFCWLRSFHSFTLKIPFLRVSIMDSSKKINEMRKVNNSIGDFFRPDLLFFSFHFVLFVCFLLSILEFLYCLLMLMVTFVLAPRCFHSVFKKKCLGVRCAPKSLMSFSSSEW